MKRALKNLEELLPRTNLGDWNFGQEIKSWHNCFIIVQSMRGASKKFEAIANEKDVEQLLDTLTEIKFAVIFNQLGFQVIIEPSMIINGISLHPDLKIMKDDHSSIVEIKRFRKPGLYSPGQRMEILPKEIPTNYVFPEIGEPKKDLQKVFNEIEKKFRQAGREGIVAIWNSNDELSSHEFRMAAHSHKMASDHNNSASFMIVRADPWEKFTCAELCKDITIIHKHWKGVLENVVPEKVLQKVLLG